MATNDFYYLKQEANGDRVYKKTTLSSNSVLSVTPDNNIQSTNILNASLQLRNGTYEQLSGVNLNTAELGVATDSKNLYLGTVDHGNITIGGPDNVSELPVPRLILHNLQGTDLDTKLQSLFGTSYTQGVSSIDRNTGGPGEKLNFATLPIVSTSNFTQSFLDSNQVFLEMVYINKRVKTIRRSTGDNPPTKKIANIVTPSPYYYNTSWSFPWPSNFRNRTGVHFIGNTTPVTMDRPNHLPVHTANSFINASVCLNGRFQNTSINYLDVSNVEQSINIYVPTGRPSGGGSPPLNYKGYGVNYKPLKIAFRYVVWKPYINNGRGEFLEGPLSSTVTVRHKVFPFRERGVQVVDIPNTFENTSFTCYFNK